MLKFLEKGDNMPDKEQEIRKNHKLNEVTSLYDHNYGNVILQCLHKCKQNQNVYIPGIIKAVLFYTMLLVIPSGLSTYYSNTPIFNLKNKAYQDNPVFRKKHDL